MPRFAIALAFLLAGSDAFAPTVSRTSLVKTARTRPTGPLFVDGPDDGSTITSGRKEIGYDSSSGRFFETNLEPEECIPEDEYCIVDKETGELVRLTLEEKERIFLDALQSYYVSGRQMLNDAEFDLLKEDLSWNGSDMVKLNRKEAKFLAAMKAYQKGEPMISDAEFDELKAELKEEGSQFASTKEPRCYIDSGICRVTYQEDNFRTNLLYLPVGAILTTLWLGFGFEVIEPIIRLNPLILMALGAPLIYKGSIALTDDYIFQNNKIVYGPCPACETENRVYFGNILGVEGFGDVASIKCTKCKVAINVQRESLRASTLPKND
mmetsp:Transcript_18199/g.38181  ORF Transcript_18199/g.38181 Transcript_18199/m.38181 type:complete len:324 (-) Transcript_18199:1966-2937(-)